MTVPFERTRALNSAKEFLEAMLDPKQTPRTPRWMRGKAKAILRHYPGLCEIEMAHKALPEVFGPVPPFPRLSASEQTQGVIDASKAADL
ncbi:BPSL0761 family protein [Rhodoferax sp.]|uniref:BPSL0761 family protein n=1 Tax=Rhodoferax sp. TaxID=50421 RepID=UPI003863DD0B